MLWILGAPPLKLKAHLLSSLAFFWWWVERNSFSGLLDIVPCFFKKLDNQSPLKFWGQGANGPLCCLLALILLMTLGFHLGCRVDFHLASPAQECAQAWSQLALLNFPGPPSNAQGIHFSNMLLFVFYFNYFCKSSFIFNWCKDTHSITFTILTIFLKVTVWDTSTITMLDSHYHHPSPELLALAELAPTEQCFPTPRSPHSALSQVESYNICLFVNVGNVLKTIILVVNLIAFIVRNWLWE